MTFKLSFSQQEVSFAINAHQDDWQLFMASNITNDLSNGAKVVFITLTAGDAGIGSGGTGIIPYYLARERGAVYSSKFAQDIFVNNPEQLSIQNNFVPVTYIYNNTSISHNISKYVYKNCISYFLRLPDGGINGTGFIGTGYKSLQKLRSNTINTISPVDNSTIYNGWNDLMLTIKQIIINEKGSDSQVWLNIPSTSTTINSSNYNPNDHSDHKYTSILSRDAVSNLSWVGIAGWVMYHSSSKPANLINHKHQDASALFAMYNWGLIESGYNTNYEVSHQNWLPMDYYAIERLPNGSSNRIIQQTENVELIEIPLLLDYKNPLNHGEEINLKINPFEEGELKVEIFELTGKMIAIKKYNITKLEVIDVSLQDIKSESDIIYIKLSLNNLYQDTCKIILK